MSTMTLVDGYLLKHRSNKEILPSNQEYGLFPPEGGMVFPPTQGLKNWVAVFDLKSLYPSTMISLNISPETIVTDGSHDIVIPHVPLNTDRVEGDRITEDDIDWSPENGTPISLDRQGIIPRNVAQLFPKRDHYKGLRSEYGQGDPEWDVFDNQQRSIKVLMNSFFGVSGNDYFRLSVPGMAGAITSGSRYVTWKASRIIEDITGEAIVYGDTDSVFVQFPTDGADPESFDAEEVVEWAQGLNVELNDRLVEVADDIGLPDVHPFLGGMDLHGTDRHCWVFEAETVLKRFIQTGSKKRYSGSVAWDEGDYFPTDDPETVKLKTTGYETNRADLPEIGSDVQETVLKKVLTGSEFTDVSQYIQETIDKVRNEQVPLEELGVPSSLNSSLDEYGNIPRARAARHTNNYIDDYHWQKGDEPFRFYTKESPVGVRNTDVIAIPWNATSLPEGYELDLNAHVEKHLENPLKPIFEEMGWKFKNVRTGHQPQSLDLSADVSGDPFADDNDSTDGQATLDW